MTKYDKFFLVISADPLYEVCQHKLVYFATEQCFISFFFLLVRCVKIRSYLIFSKKNIIFEILSKDFISFPDFAFP